MVTIFGTVPSIFGTIPKTYIIHQYQSIHLTLTCEYHFYCKHHICMLVCHPTIIRLILLLHILFYELLFYFYSTVIFAISTFCYSFLFFYSLLELLLLLLLLPLLLLGNKAAQVKSFFKTSEGKDIDHYVNIYYQHNHHNAMICRDVDEVHTYHDDDNCHAAI